MIKSDQSQQRIIHTPSKMNLFYLLRHPLMLQIYRFGITGGFSTLLHFVMVILLVEVTHWPPLNANIMGFLTGFSVSFIGHRYWTFSGTTRAIKASLPFFFVVAIANFFVNQGLFYICLNQFHFYYIISLAIATGFTALLTFTISKIWIFRVEKS